MIYGSVCSGIEAASVAWQPLGWSPAFFSEIEKFPCAVLAHHHGSNMPGDPMGNGVPNYGDMTNFEEWPDHGRNSARPIDLLVGGTPCQDNSVGHSAGTGYAGAGLDGTRSGLAFSFVGILGRYRPEWFVWENVPNLLNHRLAGGFLRFVRRITEIGYSIVWRVLDDRWFGLRDQPRPRLFMVGHLADYRKPAAVLLEPQGTGGDFKAFPQAAPVLTRTGGMAYDDRTPCILDGTVARIATPLEWERAMGFPDNHTRIPWRGKPPESCPDGPRYKAIGNSMAVNVMLWIGMRIDLVEGIE